MFSVLFEVVRLVSLLKLNLARVKLCPGAETRINVLKGPVIPAKLSQRERRIKKLRLSNF